MFSVKCQFFSFAAHIAQGIPAQQQAPPPHAHAHPSQLPPSTSYQQQPMTYAAYPPAVTGNLTTQGEVVSHAGQTIIAGPSAGRYPRTQAFSPQPALVTCCTGARGRLSSYPGLLTPASACHLLYWGGGGGGGGGGELSSYPGLAFV